MALTSITRDFVVRSGILSEGTAIVTSSTGMTATLQVTGGAAIAKNLIVGTTATIWGPASLKESLTVAGASTLASLTATVTAVTNLTVSGQSTFNGNIQFNGALNTFSGALFVTGTNIFAVGTGQSSFDGIVRINNTTAVGAGTGALIVQGGEYIAGALRVDSNAYNTATNTANAIYTPGGIYADRGLTVGSNGPVLFKGPVTFNGTATYVLSTNTYYTDNLLELHTPPGGVYSQWETDDGKDIGFRFHYYTNSTDTNASLVLANDTKYLEWYSAGAEGTSTFAGSSYGTFKTGNIILVGDVQTYSTNSGSLQVQGGAGISGGLVVGGTITATNVIANISGTASQANNLNGGAVGSLLYQSAPNVTAFLPIGTVDQVLVVSNSNVPSWINTGSFSAGSAINITGGAKDQIPYQSTSSITTFSSNLVFNGTTFTTTNIVVSGTTDSVNYGSNTGSFVTAGGAGIAKSLYVGEDVTVGSVSTQTVVPAFYSNNSFYSSYTSQFIVTNSNIDLDTYSASAYRTAKYLIQIVDGSKIQVEEILVTHDSTNIYMSEYAIASNQGELGTFDASLLAGIITLSFQANYTPTNMTIKMVRQAITL